MQDCEEADRGDQKVNGVEGKDVVCFVPIPGVHALVWRQRPCHQAKGNTHQYRQCPDRYAHCSGVNLHSSARDECSQTGWSSQGRPDPDSSIWSMCIVLRYLTVTSRMPGHSGHKTRSSGIKDSSRPDRQSIGRCYRDCCWR